MKPPGRRKPIKAAGYRAATVALAIPEQPKVIVEVGVYQGALSKLLSAIPGVERYYIVDSWDGAYTDFGQAHMDGIAAGVIEWAGSTPHVKVFRMDSAFGAAMFDDESIDFFHTDGDHTDAGIRADITNWYPKVRIGGIISGDNYEAPSVAGGVDELLPGRQIGAKGRLWWYRKSSATLG